MLCDVKIELNEELKTPTHLELDLRTVLAAKKCATLWIKSAKMLLAADGHTKPAKFGHLALAMAPKATNRYCLLTC